MKRLVLLAVCIGWGSALSSSAARGDVEFSFTGDGGGIPAIAQEDGTGVSIFSVAMNNSLPGPISSLELVLTGLSHTNPEDLDVYLISPFGAVTTIMTDRGDGNDLNNALLTFSDAGIALPGGGDPLVSGSTYQTEETSPSIAGALGFEKYVGTSGGTDSWILLVIDDASGDTGSLTSFTLQGTAVPEPATLSLLVLGALTALRRRVWRRS